MLPSFPIPIFRNLEEDILVSDPSRDGAAEVSIKSRPYGFVRLFTCFLKYYFFYFIISISSCNSCVNVWVCRWETESDRNNQVEKIQAKCEDLEDTWPNRWGIRTSGVRRTWPKKLWWRPTKKVRGLRGWPLGPRGRTEEIGKRMRTQGSQDW